MAAKFNKGDVSEGILCAAITARFLSKTKVITSTDVLSTIKTLNRPVASGNSLTTTTKFNSPNAQPKVVDHVTCKINLAKSNMNAFLDASIYTRRDIMELVNAAVKYANGTYIMEWADMMYNNNQYNDIHINAEGLLDQTGTKVDLKIMIDGKQAGVGVSLKAGDVKQFGQVSGSTWKAMKDIFEPLGVKFTTLHENAHVDMLSKKQVAPALTTIYTEAYNQLKKMDQKKLIKALADFVKYHATLNEENVVLVQLNRSQAKVYDFEILEQKLRYLQIDCEIVSGNTSVLNEGGYQGKGGLAKNKIPKIRFTVAGTVLIEIRVKLEGNRIKSNGTPVGLTVRNYVEKGSKATELLT